MNITVFCKRKAEAISILGLGVGYTVVKEVLNNQELSSVNSQLEIHQTVAPNVDKYSREVFSYDLRGGRFAGEIRITFDHDSHMLVTR